MVKIIGSISNDIIFDHLEIEHDSDGTHSNLGDVTFDSIIINQTGINNILDLQDNGTTIFKIEDGPVFFTALNGLSRGFYSNLIVQTNASNPTYQVDINADYIILESTTEPKLVAISNVDLTADIEETEGINAKEDSGMESASEWVYIWVIYNESTSTVASVLSEASTWASVVKTNISGYNYAKLVGSVYNDSSQDFVAFLQRDNRVTYKAQQQILTNGTATSWTSINISAYVPSIVTRVSGHVLINASGGTNQWAILELAADTSVNYPCSEIAGWVAGTLGGEFTRGYWEQELTSQAVAYKGTASSSTPTHDINLQTYWINI